MGMSTPYVRLRSISYDDSVHDGQIQLILGPMFSGKTTELIRRIKRYSIANYRCLKIKYSHDTRYDENSIATHDQQKIEAVSAERLAEVKKIAATNEVIGIDEGQFFPDIVSFCEDMANLGKIVIVAALDGTYQKKGFGDILNLIPLAESVVKLTAVCMLCFKDASFTQRKSIETEIEVIGGADKYLAVCRTCFIAPSTSSEKNGTVLSKNRIPLGELNPADLME